MTLGTELYRCADCDRDKREDQGRKIVGEFVCANCEDDREELKAARAMTLPLF